MSTTHPHWSPEAPFTRLVIFGEVLLDCFPDGRRVLGGAPFNVAWGLAGFGQNPLLISAVGNDADGRLIQKNMEAWKMDTSGLQIDELHPTGEVQVTIQNDEASYEICENRAWDFISAEGLQAREFLYHGLLALRNPVSRQALETIVKNSSATRFFDVNLRPPYDDAALIQKWLQNADWVKLNLDELRTLTGQPDLPLLDCETTLAEFRSRYEIKNILLTAGSEGALISGQYGKATFTPAPNPPIMTDTVGAGDSFSAVTIDGILKNLPPEAILKKASHFASKVCGLRGATSNDPNFYTTSHHD